jgi:hypothetical protein
VAHCAFLGAEQGGNIVNKPVIIGVDAEVKIEDLGAIGKLGEGTAFEDIPMNHSFLCHSDLPFLLYDLISYYCRKK